ncbi:IS66 family insertion sequence element accessory protein TnpA [Solidesulfovibrio sp. C21]|uniref:IS66 family insertion sequence element accessory protein TnpA n=1 Tax=Solidesulfovibrio sp. C21 TaxID=3398613 RepID=UPI0039FD9B65
MAAPATEVRSLKAAYWSEHVAAWQRSGLSQGAYCRQHGLSQSSLSYWRKRLGATNDRDAASFVTIVPVPLLASAQADMATAPEPLLVHVGDGFRIEIRGDFAAPLLEKLVRTLTRL